jgi:hypothetical protein
MFFFEGMIDFVRLSPAAQQARQNCFPFFPRDHGVSA